MKSKNINYYQIEVDCGIHIGDLKPIWRSIGYDEINWTYTPRGKRLLKQVKALCQKEPYYIRNHHALTTGNGLSTPTRGSCNVYTLKSDGNIQYNFSLLDQVYDTFLQNGCKPIIELGFMPDCLSNGPNSKPTYDYSRNDLWRYPPRNYRQWEELIYRFVKHCLNKYGTHEISTWYWELWNEPDSILFFKGNINDYCKEGGFLPHSYT